MFVFGIKVAWGIAKILATVVLLPLLIVGFACIAIPVLTIVGIIALIGGLIEA